MDPTAPRSPTAPSEPAHGPSVAGTTGFPPPGTGPDSDGAAFGGALDPATLPSSLTDEAEVVLQSGVLMLGAGTSGLRVREVMRAVSSSVGIDRLSAQVTSTDIVVTVGRGIETRTLVGEIGSPGVNAHRIALLKHLAETLPGRCSPAEIAARLRAVERTRPLHPLWLLILLVALACASVTVLGGGGWREAVAVLPASALGFFALRRLQRWQINHLATVWVAAVASCGSYIGLASLITLLTGASSPRTAVGFIGAAIFLIPGFPLVTGGLDLGRLDLQAGVPRIAYAGMVLLAIALGVWVVAVIAGISPDPAPALATSTWLTWFLRVVASFLAVYGWAMMFNSPTGAAVTSGVVAVAGNLVRLALLDQGVSNHAATFVGGLLMGLLCALAGRWFRLEKIIMTVPTLLVLIPGSSALRTMLYFDASDVVLAVQNLVATGLAVVAMIAGLSVARMVTDPEWAFSRPELRDVRLARLRETLGFRRRSIRGTHASHPDQ